MRIRKDGSIALDNGCYIPANAVRSIVDNLRSGIGYPECSPLYDIPRDVIAFILTDIIYKGGLYGQQRIPLQVLRT